MALETSVVTSILLKNTNKTNIELNGLFPDVSVKTFSANRIQLEKKGLLLKLTSNKLDKINKIVNTSNDNNKQEAIKIIKDNLTLSSKELHKLFPHISHQQFTWARWDLFPNEREEKILKNSLKANDKKATSFKDRGFEHKNKVRETVSNYLKNLNGNVMALPHINCLCIQAINKVNPNLSYVGVDDDKEVIKGMRATKKLLNLNLDIKFGELNNVIRNYGKDSFIAMNLDYCGTMPIQATSFKYAIDNDLIQVGGFLFLTFQKSVRNVKNGYGGLFNELAKINNREITGLCDSEYANDELLKILKTDKFEIVKKLPYQSKVPMIFYALQRIK